MAAVGPTQRSSSTPRSQRTRSKPLTVCARACVCGREQSHTSRTNQAKKEIGEWLSLPTSTRLSLSHSFFLFPPRHPSLRPSSTMGYVVHTRPALQRTPPPLPGRQARPIPPPRTQKPRTRRPSLALAARASPHAARAPCHALAPIVRVCGAAMRGGRPEAGAGLPAQTHADAEPPIAGGTFCFPSAPRTHPSLPLSLPSKTRGLGAGRKLKNHRRSQLWADKNYKKSHLGSEWRKPFAGASHAKGIVLEKM